MSTPLEIKPEMVISRVSGELAILADLHLVSDHGDLIARTRPDGWFFGHTHYRTRKRVGATDLRNVSLGYPGDSRSGTMPGVLDLCRWR